MDIEFNKREDQNRLKLSEINRLLTEIKKEVVKRGFKSFVMKEK
jgi:hypothetical protein